MRHKSAMKVLLPILALCMCGVLVLLERYGITSQDTENAAVYQTLAVSNEAFKATEPVEEKPSCLLLTSGEEVSAVYQAMMESVLSGMKITYDVCQVEDGFDPSCLKQYDTAVITFQSWDTLGEQWVELWHWIQQGGSLMVSVTPAADGSFGAMAEHMGILSLGDSYPEIFGFRLLNNCMIGAGEQEVFPYALDGEEGLQTTLDVELDGECQVWMESGDGQVPLLWTRDCGEGRIAVLNEVIADKYHRGFLCLAFSLLSDAVIYPVINGSAFYLDDFPSPVPGGNSEYIRRDYGMDTASFYSNIWWPKMLEWEETYGIRHTGLIIEVYSDEVMAPFEGNEEASQFLTYGNMLLNHNGELGFHGYNHMPLCQKGIDEHLQFGDYNLWNSGEDMRAALAELQTFSSRLFPENTFAVYVPPSNIMSESGKQALLDACPDIHVIASTYLRDGEGIAYEQEFQVEEDGTVSTPRIVSGCLIDEYQKIAALSELNFHYVQSHFLHPDDVLDEDRGAEEGWEKMSQEFENYLDWIYSSAPDIRSVTGSEMGVAVERYDKISMKRELKNGEMDVSLGGFAGEAQFLMRVNQGEITGSKGCTFQKITGNLYSIQANEAELKIYFGE